MPFKQKRRTRATIAKEKGLSSLAELLINQEVKIEPSAAASEYISEERGVFSIEDALDGASDIIAEGISEDKDTRKQLRNLFLKDSVLSSTLVKKNKEKGEISLKIILIGERKSQVSLPTEILAIFRGENEGVLRIKIRPDQELAERLLV